MEGPLAALGNDWREGRVAGTSTPSLYSKEATWLAAVSDPDSHPTDDLASDADDLSALARSLTPPKRHLILVAVSMGAMLHSMAATSVSVVLPQLQGSLSATPDQIAWVITLAVIGSVVATPISGWMVDRLGWRNVMLIAVVGFSISTILCASATTLAPMLVFRLFQGAFGAPMIPVAQAILLATYPIEDRAWSQSLHGIATVLGQAVAPVIGGYFAEAYDWRWSFLYLLPLAAIAVIMTFMWVPRGGVRRGARLDWPAFISLALAISAFQLALDRGERLYWYESGLITIYTIIALVGFVYFLLRTFSQDKPFIDLSLFLDKNFALGTLLIIVFGMVSFLPNFLYPVILGNLQGYPENAIAQILFIRGLGLLVGFVLVGFIAQPFPRFTLVLGFLCAGAAGVQGMFFTLNIQYAHVAWASFTQGFGVALIWVPAIVIAFSTLPSVLLAQSSALFHLIRQVAMSATLAVTVAITLRTSSISYAELTSQLNPDTPERGSWDVKSLEGMARLSEEIERQAQMIGYINGFVVYTAGCVVGMLLSLVVGGKRR